MVHFHDGVADSVEEISVVRYHEEGAARAAEVAFKELDRVDVQVVCRLVHDEELRLACKHLGESDSLDLTSGEFLHLLVRIGQVEASQELYDSVFILPKVLLVKVLCEFRA